jgi:hypothetical protein
MALLTIRKSRVKIIVVLFYNFVPWFQQKWQIKEIVSNFSGGGPVVAAAAAASVLSSDPLTLSAAMAHAATVVRLVARAAPCSSCC